MTGEDWVHDDYDSICTDLWGVFFVAAFSERDTFGGL
jgi:hypothetical protein